MSILYFGLSLLLLDPINVLFYFVFLSWMQKLSSSCLLWLIPHKLLLRSPPIQSGTCLVHSSRVLFCNIHSIHKNTYPYSSQGMFCCCLATRSSKWVTPAMVLPLEFLRQQSCTILSTRRRRKEREQHSYLSIPIKEYFNKSLPLSFYTVGNDSH